MCVDIYCQTEKQNKTMEKLLLKTKQVRLKFDG
jgi:hypothetical protein